jgi:hypothetical protein
VLSRSRKRWTLPFQLSVGRDEGIGILTGADVAMS